MKYLIIGAGGTGGCIGGYLAHAGREVTMVVRGAHLEAIRANGLKLNGSRHGDLCIKSLHACPEAEYEGIADVIFVCVKGYSMPDVLPLIRRASDENTLIIPILNGVGIGKKLADMLPDRRVLEGCIYIVSSISGPGEVTQSGNIFRVIFGDLTKQENTDRLEAVAEELCGAGVDAVVSKNISCDTFRKFMFVSPMAASGAYLDSPVGAFHVPGEARELFASLIKELYKIAAKLGYEYDVDLVADGLARLDAMGPSVTSSMHRDVEKGGRSELDEQVFEPVRMARALGVDAPCYTKIAEHFGFKA